MSHQPNRIFRPIRRRLGQSILAPLLITSSSWVSAGDAIQGAEVARKAAPYYRDAQICRARSPLSPPAEGKDPATQLNADAYLACLGQLGYRQDKKTDPLIVALKRCYAMRPRSVTASGESRYRAPSQAQMRVCLASRGFPSSGRAPDPNAPAFIGPLGDTINAQDDDRKGTQDPKPKSWEKSDDDRIETVIIPPRNASDH